MLKSAFILISKALAQIAGIYVVICPGKVPQFSSSILGCRPKWRRCPNDQPFWRWHWCWTFAVSCIYLLLQIFFEEQPILLLSILFAHPPPIPCHPNTFLSFHGLQLWACHAFDKGKTASISVLWYSFMKISWSKCRARKVVLNALFLSNIWHQY